MLQPKPYIQELTPSGHGGPDYGELLKLHLQPEEVLDFSVSTNPFGPPPGLKEVINQLSIDRYPDSESGELINALAAHLQVLPSNVTAGSGSTELIRLIAAAYLGPGDTVVIPQPTYSEYNTASQMVGARVIQLKLSAETDFRLNPDELQLLIKKHHPRLIFICNPNNPTGQYLNGNEVGRIVEEVEDALLVLDEAYISFASGTPDTIKFIDRNNLVILRSMTKDFALAGLRLGYAAAGEPIISVLKKIKPPWNVNTAAQLAGVYAIKNEDYLELCRAKLKDAATFLSEELKALGLTPVPSQANFFLVKVGKAACLKDALIRKGILVRDCTSFGLPEYIRLSTRTLFECQQLIKILKEIEFKRYAI